MHGGTSVSSASFWTPDERLCDVWFTEIFSKIVGGMLTWRVRSAWPGEL